VGLQALEGAAVYLVPGASSGELRKAMMPCHRFFGGAAFTRTQVPPTFQLHLEHILWDARSGLPFGFTSSTYCGMSWVGFQLVSDSDNTTRP